MSPNSSATSGIATSSTGEKHIPSSTRADGSVRKEIKVRPGYRPPEDVEVYKNRTAAAWKNRGKGGVPGAEYIGEKATKGIQTKSKKTKKQTGEASTTSGEQQAEAENTTSASKEPVPVSFIETEPTDPEAEKEKQARKLSKKLRQARDLQQKKEDGDALLPEQFEKVIRINELIRQLDSLGFDADGEKKT